MAERLAPIQRFAEANVLHSAIHPREPPEPVNFPVLSTSMCRTSTHALGALCRSARAAAMGNEASLVKNLCRTGLLCGRDWKSQASLQSSVVGRKLFAVLAGRWCASCEKKFYQNLDNKRLTRRSIIPVSYAKMSPSLPLMYEETLQSKFAMKGVRCLSRR
jgi:hypothetical protein